MKYQVIKSTDNEPEFVLVPIDVYQKYRHIIELDSTDEYESFVISDYVNAAAKMRIEAGLTQNEMAKKLGVSQAYISKLENQKVVAAKALRKLQKVLG